MLVLEPSKRYSISQIKRHRWMQTEIPAQVKMVPTITTSSSTPNEQILRLMQSLGIDSSKTREVCFKTYTIGINNKINDCVFMVIRVFVQEITTTIQQFTIYCWRNCARRWVQLTHSHRRDARRNAGGRAASRSRQCAK